MESNITNHNPLGPGSYITVTHGMSGYFAVWIHINRIDHAPDEFPEPWETGFGRYPDAASAAIEAEAWALELGLPYRP